MLKFAIPKGKSVFLQKLFSEEKEKDCKKRYPGMGIQYMSLLHDDVPSYKSAIVQDVFKKVCVIPHVPYWPDLFYFTD